MGKNVGSKSVNFMLESFGLVIKVKEKESEKSYLTKMTKFISKKHYTMIENELYFGTVCNGQHRLYSLKDKVPMCLTTFPKSKHDTKYHN